MPTAPKWVNDILEKIALAMLRTVTVESTTYLSPSIKVIRLKGDFSSLDFKPGYE